MSLVGTRLKCINAEWSGPTDPSCNHTFADQNPCPLIQGKVYTIKEVVSHSSIQPDGMHYYGPHFILNEVEYPNRHGRGFAPIRFKLAGYQIGDVRTILACHALFFLALPSLFIAFKILAGDT